MLPIPFLGEEVWEVRGPFGSPGVKYCSVLCGVVGATGVNLGPFCNMWRKKKVAFYTCQTISYFLNTTKLVKLFMLLLSAFPLSSYSAVILVNDGDIFSSMQIGEYNLKVLSQKSYRDSTAQAGARSSSLNPARKTHSSFPPPSSGQRCPFGKSFCGVGIRLDMMGEICHSSVFLFLPLYQKRK